jgi:DNA-binding NtrC family response regulator
MSREVIESAARMSLVPNSRRLSVTVVESDNSLRQALDGFLRARGYTVTSFASGSSAIRHLRDETDSVDLVLTDLALTDATGLEILQASKERSDQTQVVTLPTFAQLDAAIDTMRQGAFDYVIKPFKLTQVEIVLNKVSNYRQLREENSKLAERVQSLYDRLDHLKDTRDKLDRSTRDTFDKLDYQTEMLEECLSLLRKKSP